MISWKRNLYILWMTQVISLMSFGFGIPFIPFYIEELGVGPDQIDWYAGVLSMAPAVAMAFMAPVWGRLADRFGRKLMILRAMGAAVFIIGGMGLVNNVYALITLRVGQGFFTGTVTAASAFVASNTPKERLSYALGFMGSSTFIGYSLGPALGGLVADTFGYRVSFFIGGGLMCLGFLLVLIFLKEDPNTYGSELIKAHGHHQGKVVTVTIASFLGMLFLHRFSRSVFAPFLGLYLKSIRGDEGIGTFTGMVNMAVGLSTAVAGLTLARLGDKYKKENLIYLYFALALVISLGITQTTSLPMFLVLYTAMFFMLGGIEPLITSTTAQLTPAHLRGRLFGIQGMVGSLGWVVSPMTGAAVSSQFGYTAIFWVFPVALGLNLALAWRVKRKVG